MKKIAVLGLVFLFLASCVSMRKVEQKIVQFAPEDVVSSVNAHTVAINVFYYMDEEELNRRLKRPPQTEGSLNPLQTVVVLDNSTVLLPDGTPAKLMAYIGAGTLLKDNYVLSVNHLFEDDYNTVATRIWVFQKNVDHGIKAEIVARTGDQGDFHDDYAVLKLSEDLGMPGLEIAEETEFTLGDRVIFTGSVQATAFFSRFSFITEFHRFFNRNDAGKLELTMWETFPYYCVYPSGGGDSGGNICTVDGKIISVMYCGISIYGTTVVFGNPNEMLWQFLKDNELEWLGK